MQHGSRPFLVTTCNQQGMQTWWEWPVDPVTRQPDVDMDDVAAIQAEIDHADIVCLHNSKFDVGMLEAVGVSVPWPKVRDTFVMAHLLASNHPHNLTDTAIEYLGPKANILKFEQRVMVATQQCRKVVEDNSFSHVGIDTRCWRIAREGLEDMPSVKGSSDREQDKPWKNDMWLLRALARAILREPNLTKLTDLHKARLQGSGYPLEWWTAALDYANADSAVELPLYLRMEQLVTERKLCKIFAHRSELPRVAYEMESRGVTIIGSSTDEMIAEYDQSTTAADERLVEIAAEFGHDIKLAAGTSMTDSTREFFYGAVVQGCPRCKYVKHVKHWNGGEAVDKHCPKCAGRKRNPKTVELVTSQNPCLGLRPIKSSKTGNASLDKDALAEYIATADDGPALDFMRTFQEKRLRETALTYMLAYKRHQLPTQHPGYYRIHSSLNPCATNHLRWASNSPNLQNVSKKEAECGYCDGEGCGACGGTGRALKSLRNCFGPMPGREWWTMDYHNIERRIPAFESGEPKMVEVFERPDEPPFFGSLYCLTASVLYPDEYWPLADRKDAFKKERPNLYKRSKFFDLAKQYGCGRKKGDALSGIRNSFDLVDNEFPLLSALQRHYLNMAEKLGYVETMPDKFVDPDRGYPILASRTEDGYVLSTTPFNYHVSGTACWVKNQALVRCGEQIAEWNAEGWDGYISLEIHDEILFDCPAGTGPEPWLTNLPRMRALQRLMEMGGEGIGVPTPVSVEYHSETWATGMSL